MIFTRRAALAGIGSLVASRAIAADIRRIAFIGNSFTCEHEIAERIRSFAETAGQPFEPTVYCQNGMNLDGWFRNTDIVRHSEFGGLGKSLTPAFAYVLQDHSIEPLSADARQRSEEIIRAFLEFTKKPAVLFATWARKEGHKLYLNDSMPKNPISMTEQVHRHYAAIASQTASKVAPVGRAWQRAIDLGHDLHANDGYHANETGAHLTSLVLAHALGISLPADDPLAEIAATTPT